MPVEDDSGDPNRGKQVRGKTNHQRNGKAFDRTGTEQEKERSGHQRGDVRIDDGQKSLVETDIHGGSVGFAVAQFFAYALEDEHVGVNAHTYSEHNSGNAG